MIAYNSVWLDNLYIRQQAAEAFQQSCLKKEELDGINNQFPVGFYTPNFFIRIGLFILTTVILLFSFGILSLVFLNSIEHAIGGLAIFFAMLSYAVLEYMIKAKNHFKSGVDDALIWISAISFTGGISFLLSADTTGNCWLIFIFCVYYSLRFGDRVVSMAGYIALLGVFFFTISQWGIAAKPVIPFVLMAASFGFYLIARRIQNPHKNLLYFNCLQVLSISALVSLYLSVNYYVVSETGNGQFNFGITAIRPLSFGWMYWIFTLAIPFIYIARGIQKKDILLIRIALILIVAAVFTVRHYYSFGPIEVIMTVGGIILIACSYGLTRYLGTPKFGFSNMEAASVSENEKMRLESIIIAQTFATPGSSSDSKGFGGGSFGGGGASSDF